MKNTRVGKTPIYLLIYAFLFYAIAIHFRLADFPIYFFCDEAVHGVEAASIGESGRDQTKTLLPLFPRGLGQHQLGASVYAQIPFTRILGLSEYSTRLRNVIISFLAIWAVIQLLMQLSGHRWSWIAPFVCLTSPIWFLHFRSGYESPMALAFLLAGLAFFVRGVSHRATLNWTLAAICGAVSFYSYVPARGWIVLLAVVMFLLNFKVISKNRQSATTSALVYVFLMVPFLFFMTHNPDAAVSRLRSVGLQDFLMRPVLEQISIFGGNYLKALDPRFWFTWAYTYNSGPEERHIIPKLAPLATWLLPFFVVGLGRLFVLRRTVIVRSLLALVIIAPIPSSAFGITSLRILPVGATYLIIALSGLILVLDWISTKLSARVVTSTAVVFLSGYGIWFVDYALNVAPFKYQDYKFYGIQYGIPQTFGWIKKNGGQFKTVNLASNLFNATEIFNPFYLSEARRAQVVLRDPWDVCRNALGDDETNVWIVSSLFLQELSQRGCPVEFDELDAILDPLRRPVISIGQFRNTKDFNTWFKADQLRRHSLVNSTATLELGDLEIAHSKFDIGEVKDLFDDNFNSIVRTGASNPLVLEFTGQKFNIARLRLRISNNRRVELRVSSVSGEEITIWPKVGIHSKFERFDLESFNPSPGALLNKLRIELEALDAPENGFVHLSEIDFE